MTNQPSSPWESPDQWHPNPDPSGQPANPYAGWDPSGQSPAYQQYPQPPNYPQPGIAYGPVRPEHPRATLIMVFGILSVVGAVFGPLTVFGPVALFMALGARKDIQTNPGMYAEGGKITGGLVMGIIGTVLLVLGLISLVLYILVFATTYSRY